MREPMRGAGLRNAPLRVALLAVAAIVLIFVSVLDRRGGMPQDEAGTAQLAANREQLRKACDGMLPYRELERFVPGDVAGELSQAGTLLESGEGHHALLDCSLSWGAYQGIEVRAEPLLTELPHAPYDGEALFEAPGTTGQFSPEEGAWLLAECPEGLGSRPGRATEIYVSVRIQAEEEASKDDEAEEARALTGLRTAVHIANEISEYERCGGRSLKMPTKVVAADGSSRSNEGSNEPAEGTELTHKGEPVVRGDAALPVGRRQGEAPCPPTESVGATPGDGQQSGSGAGLTLPHTPTSVPLPRLTAPGTSGAQLRRLEGDLSFSLFGVLPTAERGEGRSTVGGSHAGEE